MPVYTCRVTPPQATLSPKAWLWRHKWHLAASPVVFVLFTLAHELAHVAAASAQGATITAFSILPDGNQLGFMAYDAPDDPNFSHVVVSLAPYAMWAGLMALVSALAFLRSKPLPFALASTLFVWGFAGAFGDIALAAARWLEFGGDLFHALGPATNEDAAIVALTCLAVPIAGYFVHRRLYGQLALAAKSYALLAGGSAIALALLSLVAL